MTMLIFLTRALKQGPSSRGWRFNDFCTGFRPRTKRNSTAGWAVSHGGNPQWGNLLRSLLSAKWTSLNGSGTVRQSVHSKPRSRQKEIISPRTLGLELWWTTSFRNRWGKPRLYCLDMFLDFVSLTGSAKDSDLWKVGDFKDLVWALLLPHDGGRC